MRYLSNRVAILPNLQMNPTPSQILDTDDRTFATAVAKVSLEEFEVFKVMWARQLHMNRLEGIAEEDDDDDEDETEQNAKPRHIDVSSSGMLISNDWYVTTSRSIRREVENVVYLYETTVSDGLINEVNIACKIISACTFLKENADKLRHK